MVLKIPSRGSHLSERLTGSIDKQRWDAGEVGGFVSITHLQLLNVLSEVEGRVTIGFFFLFSFFFVESKGMTIKEVNSQHGDQRAVLGGGSRGRQKRRTGITLVGGVSTAGCGVLGEFAGCKCSGEVVMHKTICR